MYIHWGLGRAIGEGVRNDIARSLRKRTATGRRAQVTGGSFSQSRNGRGGGKNKMSTDYLTMTTRKFKITFHGPPRLMGCSLTTQFVDGEGSDLIQ